jgi:hypothetical protein
MSRNIRRFTHLPGTGGFVVYTLHPSPPFQRTPSGCRPWVRPNQSVDQLKPNIGGKTLGNLRPFPAKWNPRNHRFFLCRLHRALYSSKFILIRVSAPAGRWVQNRTILGKFTVVKYRIQTVYLRSLRCTAGSLTENGKQLKRARKLW